MTEAFVGIILIFALIYCLVFVNVLKIANRKEEPFEEGPIGTAPVEQEDTKVAKVKKKGASKKKAPSAKKKKKKN